MMRLFSMTGFLSERNISEQANKKIPRHGEGFLCIKTI
jgi:hypothetical protein